MRKAIVVVAASILGLLTTAAHATDSLIQAFSVPSSACQLSRTTPVSGNDGFVDGLWLKLSKGYLRVHCPMSLYGHIDQYSFIYVDPDGNSGNSSYKISLVEYYVDGIGIYEQHYCSFASNVDGPKTNNAIRYSKACTMNLIPGRTYSFEIELWNRSNGTRAVQFYGIDFKQ